jgi:hypothetical protein
MGAKQKQKASAARSYENVVSRVQGKDVYEQREYEPIISVHMQVTRSQRKAMAMAHLRIGPEPGSPCGFREQSPNLCTRRAKPMHASAGKESRPGQGVRSTNSCGLMSLETRIPPSKIALTWFLGNPQGTFINATPHGGEMGGKHPCWDGMGWGLKRVGISSRQCQERGSVADKFYKGAH